MRIKERTTIVLQLKISKKPLELPIKKDYNSFSSMSRVLMRTLNRTYGSYDMNMRNDRHFGHYLGH